MFAPSTVTRLSALGQVLAHCIPVDRANRLSVDWGRHAGALVRCDGLSLEPVPGMQKHIVARVVVEKILFQ